ncbi:MAG TPA: TonB-dependent receptor [Gammaproteobacteria bacterium]|nr:TonB-dependent receptor [Gammaproteobacteria bacterium]
MSNRFLLTTLVLFAASATIPARAAIEGVVLSPDDAPIPGATVYASETGRIAVTDPAGRFRFAQLDAGTHRIKVLKSGYSRFSHEVRFTADRPTRIRLATREKAAGDAVTAFGTIAVTGKLFRMGAANFGKASLQLTGTNLLKLQAPTLGATLASLPGIAATHFGAGASRPVIRGLGGARVRVLENGLDTLDASDLSPDHATTIEPLIAEQIEVLEGPQTLLYGSGAFGGVINVIDNRVPRYVPDHGPKASLELRGDTAHAERAAVATVDGGAGHFAYHADVTRRKAGDYEIPHEVAMDLGLENDTLPNSGLDSKTGSVGVSYVGERGYLGLAVERYLNHYEIPVGAVNPAMLAEGLPAIDQQQTRYMLLGALDEPLTGFESLTFGATYSDYRHFELEGSKIASRFIVNGKQVRVALRHEPLADFEGAVGAEYTAREFYVTGEALVPRNLTHNLGLFAVERYDWKTVSFRGGARIEHQTVDVESAQPDQSSNAVTASFGASWDFTPGYELAATVARSQRIPSAEELYYNGPHDATAAYEVGDPGLGKETSRSLDLSLEKKSGPLIAKLNLFANDIRDFIFLRRTGAQREGFPVYRYTAGHARFFGGNGRIDYAFPATQAGQFTAGAFADYVRARLVDRSQNVPRIPPLSYGLRFGYTRNVLDVDVELRRVARQRATGPYETQTPGYTNLDLNIGYDISTAAADYTLFLRASNLLDQVERSSTSFLKEIAPLPGRSFTVGVRASFD